MSFLINLVVSGIAVGIAAFLTPGVSVDGLGSAIIVALVLGLVNATIGSVLRFLSMPLNFLTLGLVGAIIGFLMLFLTDSLVAGFNITNRLSALIFAIILGLIGGTIGAEKTK